jgi:regulator of RNase E activity RraB
MKKADRTRITYDKYVLEHDVNATERYNLVKKAIVQEGKNKGGEYEVVQAYGITLERGLFLIVQDIMSEKKMEYSLKEYIEEWKRERQALTNALSDVDESNYQ